MMPVNNPFALIMQLQQMQSIQQMQLQQQQLMMQFNQQQREAIIDVDADGNADNNDEDDEEQRTLFVANLDERIDEEILYELFLQAGPLDVVRMPKQRNFAFITYTHACSPIYAMHLYQGLMLFGKPLVVKFKNRTVAPPLLRRLLPPDWGVVTQKPPPQSMQFQQKPRVFDNSSLRQGNFSAYIDDDNSAGDSNRRDKRTNSPIRFNANQEKIGDYRRHERSPVRNRHDRDWIHNSRREHSRQHHSSSPYQRERERNNRDRRNNEYDRRFSEKNNSNNRRDHI